MKELYKINEVAKIYNVSTDTLRFYDKMKLLSPWVVGENGYRYYSKAQFEIISTIMLLRSMGTSIKDIKELLDADKPDKIKNELSNRIRIIDEEILRLTELKEHALSLNNMIDKASGETCVFMEEVPKLWMFSKKFGEEDELDIDEILKVNRLAKKDWVSFAGIVSTVSIDNLLKGDFHTYDRYGYLSEHSCNVESPYLEVIPARKCVVSIARVCSTEHIEIDSAYRAAIDYINENGLKIAGEAIERNILDLYGDDSKNPIMYFKIYIPVE